MSTSIAKIEANRANAKHSTGPRTAAGKRRSRYNAFKHGFRANHSAMDRPHMNDYAELYAAVEHTYLPVSKHQLALCTRIAMCLWRLERVALAEAGVVMGPMFYEDAPASTIETGGARELDSEADPDDDSAGRLFNPDDPLARAVSDSFDKGFERGGIATLSGYEAQLSRDLERNIRLYKLITADAIRARGIWDEADVNDR